VDSFLCNERTSEKTKTMKPQHEFVCFEPTVSSEDALNRPADRLNIAPNSSRQIVLQLTAKPL
jgi:galactose mutarotase-like enzyme